jgi:SAM-dependent methyltransferase
MEWEGDHWRCESCKANGGDGGEHHLGHADFAHREKFRPGYGQLASALCNTFKFDDALDLGSGQGFLVDELIARGKKVQGVELQPAARDFMSPAARAAIQIGDFTNGASPTGDFGLVTCVEVAEHIEASRSEAVVAACTNTAHEYVYFTADDTPSRLHINPQPKAYWIEKFKKRGFALDESKTEEVKAALDGTPCPWLQKNTMVFRKEAHG